MIIQRKDREEAERGLEGQREIKQGSAGVVRQMNREKRDGF